MDNKLKELEAEKKRLMAEINKNNRRISSGNKGQEKSELLQFFIGLILLGVGLFWIFQSVTVTTMFSGFHFGSWRVPDGTVIIPLLIGIVMLFVMRRKIFGWIVLAIGVLAILLAVMNSVRFHFTSTSLFEYIFMFGFVAVGGALVLKALFAKH